MKRQYLIIICLCFFNGWGSLLVAQENLKSDRSNSNVTDRTVVNNNQNAINTIASDKNTLIQKLSTSKIDYLYIGAISLIVSLFFSLFIIFILWFVFLREKILKIVRINIERNEGMRPGRLNIAISNLVNNILLRETQNNVRSYNTDEIVCQVIEKLKKEQNYQALVIKQIEATNQNNAPIVESTPILAQRIIPSQSKYFYSIEPKSGGNFFLVDKTTIEFEETESVFVFIKQGDHSAQFRVIADIPTMKRAISYKAELLDTACDSLNGSQNTQKIITEKPGIVKKEGDKWVIIIKAKIKFE